MLVCLTTIRSAALDLHSSYAVVGSELMRFADERLRLELLPHLARTLNIT